jgi:hypothetical protein
MAIAAFASVACGGLHRRGQGRPAAPEIVRAAVAVEPAEPLVVAKIPTGLHAACSLVPAAGLIWLSGYDRYLRAVDPATNRIVGRVALPGWACHTVLHRGLLWTLLPAAGLLAAVDPVHRRIVRLARVEDPCTWGFGFGAGRLWVVDNTGLPAESERDPATGTTLRRLPPITGTGSGEAGPCAVAVAGGDVWFGTVGGVWHVEARTLKILGRLDAGPEPAVTAVAVGDQVFVGNRSAGEMRRIDARNRRVAAVYRFGGGWLAATAGELWATSSLNTAQAGGTDPILVRAARGPDRVIARYRVGRHAARLAVAPPFSIGMVPARMPVPGQVPFALGPVAVAYDSVWVAQNVEGRIYRLHPPARAASAG